MKKCTVVSTRRPTLLTHPDLKANSFLHLLAPRSMHAALLLAEAIFFWSADRQTHTRN